MNRKSFLLLIILIAIATTADAQRSNGRSNRRTSTQRTTKTASQQKVTQESGTKVASAIRLAPERFSIDGVSFTMLPVNGGEFHMGATPEQQDAAIDEQPAHDVKLSTFLIGQTEVTQALWRAVMGDAANCFFVGDNLPVEQVSWIECQDFVKRLNQILDGKTHGRKFRLPTEAEWEYAARGGNKAKPTIYSGGDELGEVGWFYSNSEFSTHIVAMKKPNELGVYDMSGNVAEWCEDWYSADYYGESLSTNPQGSATGKAKVVRGGAWGRNAISSRVSMRMYSEPEARQNYIGLRLVLAETE